jgi:endonuclease YncB( thermonuclease family)
MAMTAWYLEDRPAEKERIVRSDQVLQVADGDSFAIGRTKLRLYGIDAPEYLQTCEDAGGRTWECGKVAREALQLILNVPGLACTVTARDRYGRSLASCSTAQIPDVAAAQVAAGMAISDEFYGLRSYDGEQDVAEQAEKGIWAGTFTVPANWRTLHPSRQ